MAMSHSELRDLSGLYALGMLTGEERLEFEAHLESCPSCAAEVREARELSTRSGSPFRRSNRPPRSAPACSHPFQRPASGAAADDASGATAGAAAVPASHVRASWRWSVPYGLAAAASIAAVALGLYAMTLRERLAALERELQSARAAQGLLQGQLGRSAPMLTSAGAAPSSLPRPTSAAWISGTAARGGCLGSRLLEPRARGRFSGTRFRPFHRTASTSSGW